MFRLFKNVPAIATSLAIIGLAFIYFAINLTRSSLSEKKSEISDSQVMARVEIYRNNYGIPHIVAGSEADMFFAMGYCHAQDRLWQMDILRRTASGRLAEIFGKQAIVADKFMRAIDLRGITKVVYSGLSGQSKSILESYSKGVNAYIKHNKSKLPFEFGALSYLPDQWSPEDCVLISRAMALNMSTGFWNDLTFSEMAEFLQPDIAKALMPESFTFTPRILDPNKSLTHPKLVDTTKFDSILTMKSTKSLEELNEGIEIVKSILGHDRSSIGSNAFVNRVFNKGKARAYLSNDPHLGVTIPAHWYQIHLSSPGFNVVGASMPGMPLCLLGRNDYISWGITNAMADDCDFFSEKIDSTGNKYFQSEEKLFKPLKYYADTLFVKGSEKLIYYVRKNERSHIISDFHVNSYLKPESENPVKQNNRFFKNNAITFNWTGREKTDEFLALYRLNKASNYDEFKGAVGLWSVPSLVFAFSDNSGNIAIQPAGIIPIRQANCNPELLNKTDKFWSGWSGYWRLQDKGGLYNPPKSYIVSANNEISRDPEFVSSYWEPSSRSERMEELLLQTENYTYRDAQFIQNDCLSPYSRNILEIVLPVFNKYSNLLTDEEKKVLSFLRGWDCILSRKSIAASIYSVFFERLVYNTLYDELNYSLFRRYSANSGLLHRKMLELLVKDSKIFDDSRTPREENREYIIFKSIREACVQLKKVFNNSNPNTWTYGKMHQITLEHQFSSNPFIKPSVTIGRFETGGNSTTINNSEWSITKPYDAVVCASLRFIADMGDTLIYTSLPGGVSGDPFSPNYSDQVQIWLNGGYIKLSTKSFPVGDFKLRTVINPN